MTIELPTRNIRPFKASGLTAYTFVGQSPFDRLSPNGLIAELVAPQLAGRGGQKDFFISSKIVKWTDVSTICPPLPKERMSF